LLIHCRKSAEPDSVALSFAFASVFMNRSLIPDGFAGANSSAPRTRLRHRG
jgi:hypothetical protein